MKYQKEPLNCQEVQQRIAELPAHALATNSFGTLSSHLSSCPKCQSYAREMQALSEELNALLIPSPPEVYPNLIRALPQRVPVTPAKLVITATILLLAIILALASWFHTFRPDPSTISGQKALLKNTPASSCPDVKKPNAPINNTPNKEECLPTVQSAPTQWTTLQQDPNHN
ncbi:MAG: hypothetical protein QXI19_02975 [Candidatus Caldarchaeum sp.]